MSRLFNGTNARIEIPAVGNALDISTGPITIAVWFKSNAVGPNQGIVSKWTQGSDPNGENFLFSLGNTIISAANQVSFVIGFYGALLGVYGACATTILSGKWYHMSLVADVNGILPTSGGSPQVTAKLYDPSTGLFTPNNQAFRERRTAGGQNILIGEQAKTDGAWFNGSIAEFGIWNVPLSNDEIASLHHGLPPNAVRQTALVGYWPLYGDSGLIIEPNLTTGGALLNGTLSNSPVISTHCPVTANPSY